jgi:hypothetical protein
MLFLLSTLFCVSLHSTNSDIFTEPVIEYGDWIARDDNDSRPKQRSIETEEKISQTPRQAYQASYSYGGPPVHPTDCYIETGCSTSCGDGFRLILPNKGAAGCTPIVMQVLACNERTCPVDCAWDHWAPWAQCGQRVKRQAGYGSPVAGDVTVCSQSRARGIKRSLQHGGRQCRGENFEERYCRSSQCQGEFKLIGFRMKIVALLT